jgi:hypothetical protein
MDNGILVSPDAEKATFALPYPLPSAYRLEIAARRRTGGVLVVGLIRDKRQIPVVLESASIVLAPLDDAAEIHRRQIASQLGFVGGPAETYTCIVHPQGLLVAYEDRIQLAVGPQEDLPQPVEGWTTPGGDSLFVGTDYSVYQFHRIMLTPLQP